jgi:hypothetical protein
MSLKRVRQGSTDARGGVAWSDCGSSAIRD